MPAAPLSHAKCRSCRCLCGCYLLLVLLLLPPIHLLLLFLFSQLFLLQLCQLPQALHSRPRLSHSCC